MSASVANHPPLTHNRIFRTWWPLALGWLMMTVEIPMLAAIVARTVDPKIHLAAWGVTFPLSLIMGAPVLMMLSASAALSKDWTSYRTGQRYMFWIAGIMTGLHLLLAFTPLYDLVVTQLIAAPPEVIEPSRLGFRIMLPYALAIAYRRFNYGTLIRFGYTGAVTAGVVVRLVTDVILLSFFHWFLPVPGIVLSTATFTTGIVAEAIYSFLRVRPVIQRDLRPAPPADEPVTLPSFLAFYIPLMLTSLLQVIIQPLMSATISRMPNSLDSLAVWPVIFGFLILWTSAGQAYLEVVIVLLDEPQSVGRLRRFAAGISTVSISLLTLMVITPLAGFWFRDVVALPTSLIGLALAGIWFVLPQPALRVFESFYQGTLVNARRTRGVTEAVGLNIGVAAIVLSLGVWWGQVPGLFVALLASLIGELFLAGWLHFRARPFLKAREEMADPVAVLSPAQGA